MQGGTPHWTAPLILGLASSASLAFYALAVMIVLHLIAVVLTELHEGGSIISAMFTGPSF